MKRFTSLIGIALILLNTSCASQKKTAYVNEQSKSELIVSTDTKTTTSATLNAVTSITETDLSNTVIEITKVEYFNTNETESADLPPTYATSLKHDREAKPPNGGQIVKSVTSAKIRFNNDKNKQTDVAIQSDEVTEVKQSVSVESSDKSCVEAEVKEEPKHTLFWWGVSLGIAAVIGLILFVRYLKRRFYL